MFDRVGWFPAVSARSAIVDWFRGLISRVWRGPVELVGKSQPVGSFEPLEPRQLLTLTAYDGFEAGGASPDVDQYTTGVGFIGSGAGAPGDALQNGTLYGTTGQGPVTTGFNAASPWTTTDGYASTVYYQVIDTGLSYTDTGGRQLDTLDGAVKHLHETTPDFKAVSRSIIGAPAPAST
jgi:hypothetical protein